MQGSGLTTESIPGLHLAKCPTVDAWREREIVLHPWRNELGAGGEAVVEGHRACAFWDKDLLPKPQ